MTHPWGETIHITIDTIITSITMICISIILSIMLLLLLLLLVVVVISCPPPPACAQISRFTNTLRYVDYNILYDIIL